MAAGPLITPLDFTNYKLIPEDPVFEQLWQQNFTEIDSLDGPLQAAAIAQTGFDIVAALGSLDPIELGIESALGAFPSDTGAGGIDAITGSSAAVDTGIAGAQTAINAAANSGSSIGITLPPITGIKVTKPAAPPEPPTPPLPPVGGGGIGTPGGSFSLHITSPQHPGGTTVYRVGDQFVVHIIGVPGANIYVKATQNSRPFGQAGMGSLDASGFLDVTGSFGVADIGYWVEDWYHDTKFIRELAFTVTK